ncbi:hypothetical protein [Listeria costaricensis]|uniref:hypothetical protein n=1 Tax=Listeria costaricensis TaxID=2026604 RepID=UPI000C07ADEB|nr:hypothetical protein [Listeria costaricensis]
MRAVDFFLQMIAEPEYIAMTVTFLLMLSLFRFWPIIKALKPAMFHADVLFFSRITLLNVKPKLIHLVNFILLWLVVTLKKSSFADEPDSLYLL